VIVDVMLRDMLTVITTL